MDTLATTLSSSDSTDQEYLPVLPPTANPSVHPSIKNLLSRYSFPYHSCYIHTLNQHQTTASSLKQILLAQSRLKGSKIFFNQTSHPSTITASAHLPYFLLFLKDGIEQIVDLTLIGYLLTHVLYPINPKTNQQEQTTDSHPEQHVSIIVPTRPEPTISSLLFLSLA